MMHFQLTLPYGLVREVDLTIAPGECILLAGPNGSGKTTLLKALAEAGAYTETSGHPRLHQQGAGKAGVPESVATLGSIRGRGPLSRAEHDESWEGSQSDDSGTPAFPAPANASANVAFYPEAEAVSAYAPASASCVLIPTGIPKVKGFTLEDFVRTGCFRESNWAGKLQAETEERLQGALKQLGISHLAQRDLSTLSDGEFQKACLAIGLVRRARLLLLDEPTAFLDVDGRLAVLRTLADVARDTGTAILFSSHDLHDALRYCTRVLAFTPDGLMASTPANREEILRTAFPSLSL